MSPPFEVYRLQGLALIWGLAAFGISRAAEFRLLPQVVVEYVTFNPSGVL